jgi:hypothetical protein
MAGTKQSPKEGGRLWMIYRQYLHRLHPDFMAEWRALIRLVWADERDEDAVAAAVVRLRAHWPEAPWDLLNLEPDERFDSLQLWPGDTLATWERHAAQHRPPGERTPGSHADNTDCPVGCCWDLLPATSVYYRRLTALLLYREGVVSEWEVATQLWPNHPTVEEDRQARTSGEHSILRKRLEERVRGLLKQAREDLAALPAKHARPRLKAGLSRFNRGGK